MNEKSRTELLFFLVMFISQCADEEVIDHFKKGISRKRNFCAPLNFLQKAQH
jgi:hypothetical protein